MTETEMTAAAEDDTYRVRSLARGLALLTTIAESDGNLTAADLSRAVGVSRQTAYHLLHTLRQTGFVEQGAGQRYRLGWAVTSLVDGYGRHVAPPAAALERLAAMAKATGETCSLSVWSGDDVVLIAQEAGLHHVRVADIPVGQHGAMHARASSKILLARSVPERREKVLSDLAFTAFTPHTLTDRASLEAQIDAAAESGWAMDDEELAVGITCVASCIRIDDADFALSVLAPTDRFKANADNYVAAVLDAARPT